jgi:type IV secretory pathway VirB10-like protein
VTPTTNSPNKLTYTEVRTDFLTQTKHIFPSFHRLWTELTNVPRKTVAALKGKEEQVTKDGTTSPTRAEHPDIAGLSINSPPRQTPPPRPSAKPAFSAPPIPPPLPSNLRPAVQERQDSYQSEEEDEDDPFADRNAM